MFQANWCAVSRSPIMAPWCDLAMSDAPLPRKARLALIAVTPAASPQKAVSLQQEAQAISEANH
jgi:hypothetical protein